MKNFLTVALVGIAMLSTGCGTAKSASSSSSNSSSSWAGTWQGQVTWINGENPSVVTLTITEDSPNPANQGYQITGFNNGAAITGLFAVQQGQMASSQLVVQGIVVNSGAYLVLSGTGTSATLTYFDADNIQGGTLTH
jgi:hypothetical protein